MKFSLTSFWNRITSAGRYLIGPRSSFFARGTTVVNEDTAMKVAALQRGLVYLSTQIAKLPWDLKDAENNLIINPTSNLLNLAANPEMSAFRWRLCMVQQAALHGNAYSEIERDGIGRPIALWPLKSRQMEPLRTDSGELVYRYWDELKGAVYLSPRDVFHLPNFYTKDGVIGQGLIAYASDVLAIQIAADDMASGLFHNSGIPSGIVTHPGKISDAAYKRLKENWGAENGGKKSGGTSILEEGMKFEATEIDANMLQFLDSRKFGVIEIARFLNVPPTKLFDTTAATYSNVEQSNLEVATDILDAWATNLETEADIKILNYRYGGRFTDIDLYSVFRGDMKSRSDYYKTMMGIGAMTPNQVRLREGMPKYKEGDEYYIATNNFTPVTYIKKLLDADIKQKEKSALPAPAAPKKESTPEEKALAQAAIDFLQK